MTLAGINISLLAVGHSLLVFFILCVVSWAGECPDNLCCSEPDPSICADINELPLLNTDNENPTPIVGVLSQEIYASIKALYSEKNITSYIAASYVKFVEGAGARVVPIWIAKDRAYYEDIMSKVNGIILPGGVSHFNDTNGYADASKIIIQIAKKKNDRGEFFPLWGACLGFQYLFYNAANDKDIREDCLSWGQGLPLEFKDDFKKSRMFQDADANVINILKNYPVTSNFHFLCITEATLSKWSLAKQWRVISVNHDWYGFKFISTVEHRRYPFYGVQFHPEKTLYEYKPYRNITHTARATLAAQYFADFFVSETRKSRQSFSNKSEENLALIYNYSPTYTGLKNMSLIQQYFFNDDKEA